MDQITFETANKTTHQFAFLIFHRRSLSFVAFEMHLGNNDLNNTQLLSLLQKYDYVNINKKQSSRPE